MVDPSPAELKRRIAEGYGFIAYSIGCRDAQQRRELVRSIEASGRSNVEHVGESGARNREFRQKFSRERLIVSLIHPTVQRPVVFDVGAHVGESVLFLRRLFPASVIHSFEPSIDSFSTLERPAGRADALL